MLIILEKVKKKFHFTSATGCCSDKVDTRFSTSDGNREPVLIEPVPEILIT